MGVIGRGLLCDNEVIPGTSRVLRLSEAWYPDGHHSTRRRDGEIVSIYTQHWTGGHTATGESAGLKVYRSMNARERADGSLLDCAVNFVIGWDGTIVQLADVLTACVHVGDRVVIRRSVSTEHCWPGTAQWARKIGYDDASFRRVQIAGSGRVEIMEPSAAMMEASLWLAEALAAIRHPLVRIPRIVPATNARMTKEAVRLWHGALEHGQMAGSTKIDCVGVCSDNLAAHGWVRA